MTDMVDIDPQRITRAMRANVEGLSSTSDMLDVLISEAFSDFTILERHYASQGSYVWGEWRTIRTFLNLAISQIEIVKTTVTDFEKHSVEVAA